jgi:hypothetical protein
VMRILVSDCNVAAVLGAFTTRCCLQDIADLKSAFYQVFQSSLEPPAQAF